MNARHAKLHFTGQLSLHKDSSDIWNWHLRLTPSLRRRQRKLKFIRQLKLHTSCRQHKSDEITTNYTKNLLINILTFFFYSCIVQWGFLPWSLFVGESQLRQSRATQPTVHAGHFSVSKIQGTRIRTTGCLTCTQMLTHAVARTLCGTGHCFGTALPT